MAKFFDQGTEEQDDILESEFSEEGLNFKVELEGLECEVESSRTEEHIDITTAWNRKGSDDSVVVESSFGYNSGFFMPGATMDLVRVFGAEKLAQDYSILSFKQSLNPIICLDQKMLGAEGQPASQWLRNCLYLTAETSLVFRNGLALKLARFSMPKKDVEHKEKSGFKASLMTPVTEDRTVHFGSSLSLDSTGRKVSAIESGLFKYAEAWNAQFGVTYNHVMESEGDRTLTAKAGTVLPDHALRVAAELEIDVSESISKDSFELTAAFEKQLPNDSLLKLKFKQNGDADLAIKTQLWSGLDITVCAGMDLAEHTQASTARLLTELKNENAEKIKERLAEGKEVKDGAILVPALRTMQDKDYDKMWISPYFGINVSFKL